jgi:peptide/nickel transport system permease protein
MRFLQTRLLHSAMLMIAISFFTFLLLELAPGDFFEAMRLNPQISEQTVSGLRSEYGMDRPLLIRYERWVRSIFKGGWGFSFAYNSPVAPLLRVRARNTLLLTSLSGLLAWIIAIPWGVWSAMKRGRWSDRLTGIATSGLLTVPDLLLFLLLLLLAVRTGWFPAGGMLSPGMDGMGLWTKAKDIAYHLALPSTALAITTLPVLVRHVRSAIADVLESPFLRAARGHGVRPRRLILRYALPVAANPLISLFGLSVATLLSGSLLVEVVFGWPGLGPLLVESMLARDVYVVVGVVMLSSVFLILGNLLADVLLFLNDPRIRTEGWSGREV